MTQIIEWTKPLYDVYDPILPPARDIYYAWVDDEPNPWLLHYCLCLRAGDGRERWIWQGTGAHTLICRDPLHLEASIGWMACCGRHGFIRRGLWEPAGDAGWMPTAVPSVPLPDPKDATNEKL